MTREADVSLDGQVAELLAACDEALAAGTLPRLAFGGEVPADLRARVERSLATLRSLRRLFPHTSPNPPGAGTTEGDSAAATLPEPPFSRLGRFLIRRELGRGAYGLVFLAYDPDLDREVALKVPHGGALLSPEQRGRFLREARAAAALDHPNLMPVYEVGEVGPVCYIASAYCPGGTLADSLRQRGPLPHRAAAELVATLAQAVQHAHDRGVLHRDLKPSNVLLQETGAAPAGGEEADQADFPFVPRVTDFGAAKVELAKDTVRTLEGTIVGTPRYMAPEQAGGVLAEVGPAADVYALGVILYECLTGQPPFRAESLLALLAQVKSQAPLAPGELRPGLPPDLEKVCLQCLAKEPAGRYATAAELAADLRRFLAGQAVAAREPEPPKAAGAAEGPAEGELPPGPPPEGADGGKLSAQRSAPSSAFASGSRGRGFRRLSLRVLAVLLAGLAAAGVLFGALVFRAAPEQGELFIDTDQQVRVVLRQEGRPALSFDASASRAVAVEAGAYEAEVIRLPGGAREKTRLVVPSGGRGILTVRSPRAPPPRRTGPLTLRRAGSQIVSVAFYPDGRRLASASNTGVNVWDLETGKEALPLQRGQGAFFSVAVSPDGKYVVGGSRDTGARVWDCKTGKFVTEIPAPLGEVRSLSFHPDAKRLAAACRRDPVGHVVVWELLSGKEERVLTAALRRETVCAAYSPDGKLLAAGLNILDEKGRRSGSTEVQIWEAKSGKGIRTLGRQRGIIWQVAFSPDGKRLASAWDDGTARVWDAATGEESSVFRGHRAPRGYVSAVAFSRDGKHVASIGGDRVIRVWDAATAEQVLLLRGHRAQIWSVAFSPDGKRLASGAEDGFVKVWDVSGLPR